MRHFYFTEFPPKETKAETFYLHAERKMDSVMPQKDETDFTAENVMQAPEKLQEVAVKQKGKGALISWKPSRDKDALGYIIYKRQADPWEVMPEPLREKEKKDIEGKKGGLSALENLVQEFRQLKFADNLRQIAYVPAPKSSYEDNPTKGEAEMAYAVSVLDKEGNEGPLSARAVVKK